jgi:uncharacterized protein YyaL (SSP411 family)
MDRDKNQPVNELTNETSPYLLQHATNPVNWHPWSQAAIELAKYQDKPILLSIGYSACHWCHVMMHESFEDTDVAATMNRLFINIKVDKEERPDLDKIYQTAHQLLMGRPGGWPLTMFLSPETLIPYFGGTYFPKNAQPEITDFQTLLHRLNDVYYHQKQKIKEQELHTLAILQVIYQPRPSSELPLAETLKHCAEEVMQKEFDPVYGGFGTEAKFPNCPSLDFLLRAKDPLMQHIALYTLIQMAQSGLYDQLAGGFFRYTVDQQWQIPHFEKMLYDNGQLLSIYAQAYKLTQNKIYRDIALETGAWLATSMQDPNSGGFYAAVDADIEGKEGLYYVWDLKDIKKVLTGDEYSSIKKYYKLDHKANFDELWHLSINAEQPAPDSGVLQQIKQKLSTQRTLRPAAHIDNKILTCWNALAIKGLSEAGQLLDHRPFLELADKTIKFFKDQVFVDKQLYASFQAGKPKINGFLDDYAFLLDAVLCFVQHNPQHEYIVFCNELADSLIENFYDSEFGGFYFTALSAEQLFFRPKPYTDEATPAGNGIACLALLKLGKLVGNEHYIEVAKKSIYAAQAYLNDAPEIHLTLCLAYELAHENT